MPLLSHPNSLLRPKEALSASPATPSHPRALAHAAPSAWNTLLTSSVLPAPSSPSPPPGSPPCSLLGSHSPQDMGNISFSHLTNSCGMSALCQNLCWALGDTGETESRGTRLSQGGQERGPDERSVELRPEGSEVPEEGCSWQREQQAQRPRGELPQTAQGTESHARNTVNVGRGAEVRGQAVPRALESSGGSASESRPVSPQSLGLTEGGPVPEAAEDVDGVDT